MKKLIFVAVLALVSMTTFSQAQFGLKAGLNVANLTGDDMDGADPRSGGVFGVFAKINLTETIAFQPEALYSMQGATGSETEQGYDIDVTMKLDYINIPLMMKFYPADGFSINAGPQVGFLASAKAKAETQGISAEEDIKEAFKSIDFGLNVGLGYDLPMGLGLDFRYNIGLSNVLDTDEGEGKNGVLQFTASYAF
ncbi:Outer membrane protein beta-barrel domain-containing protein [Saccharicrinis carchari]|uniref:Outer membrane protein beta-barrel domain-containing protein n=1 Tax=Saccharicrinis carchari TaxID=1168039 RepID=A0A521CKU2_SACCC|nr:porin family protein [Saccharicrinis carchari]SMO60058.1 Outer membrane protein beta-barrel domain-containing protein [Saccharicrinis carchari]